VAKINVKILKAEKQSNPPLKKLIKNMYKYIYFRECKQ